MDQASAQTEKIASYETSRTRRSIVDGNIHSDDSNNDEEYATSGFYVREKTTEKRPDSAKSEAKESEKECKENGISTPADSPSSPTENGENSGDGESSKDSKKNTDSEKIEPGEKDVKSTSKEDDESENDEPSNSPKEQDEKKEDSSTESDGVQKDKLVSSEETEDCKEPEDVSRSTDKKEKIETRNDDEKESDTLEKGVKEPNDEKKEESSTEQSVVKEDSSTDSGNEEKEKNDPADKQKDDPADKEKVDPADKEKNEPADKEKDSPPDKEKNEPADKEKDDPADKEKDDPADKEKDDPADKEKNEAEADKCKENEKEEKGESPQEVAEEKSDDNNDKKADGDEVKSTEKDKPEGSILKDHLEKVGNENMEENADNEMEMDEDFDPSLLCPDISMDVDEAPVITNNEPVPEDGSTSPLPYEATFSTLVDEITGAEVQVDLTPEEMEMRQRMYGPNNLVQTTKIHCTACNIHLGSALTGANNRFVHPLLKVLICKNCYHFYTSGEFEKDEDGSELYCRWCGQGGQVLCCSSCEFVFCKRCIRNNFGPKKFKEIRDSDDWNCFRCDRGQLSNLRASCAEFMEYYRTELARAQALSRTNPELMTTDYTTCCKGGAEKKDDAKTPVTQKNSRKKKKDYDDPDYHPVIEDDGEPPKKKFGTTTPTGGPGYTVIPPAQRPVMPKAGLGQAVRPVIMQQGQKPQNQGQVFKVGNTTFRAKVPSNGQGYTIQRPALNQGQKTNSPGYITIPPSAAPKTSSPGYITIPPSAAPKTTSPGYIKILPQRMQGPRPNSYTVVSGTSNGKPTFTTVRPKQPPAMPTMKHEWFEKTVRAAARVNSNLSYTLTQLNRQQSQANSVEALAMVHNKLQEVLSTSINSLIQIRKNLRTEFISGIKNIKFPPKPGPIPPTSGPIVVKDDDDVIFVNPTQTPTLLSSPPPLVLSPTVSLTKKTPIQITSDPFADPKPSTSGVSSKPSAASSTTPTSLPARGGFLKVRSFTSLQSVPSECITIPDDPPASSDVKIIEEEDPLMITDDDKMKDGKVVGKSPVPEPSATVDEFMVYNVKDEPTPAVQKMLNAIVMVKKSRVVDEIIRAQGLLKGKENENKKKEGESKKKPKGKEAASKKRENDEGTHSEEQGNDEGAEGKKADSKEETVSEKNKEKKPGSDKTKEDEESADIKEEGGETVTEDGAGSEENS